MLFKFAKYCLVGFGGMAVDFGVTWLLKEQLKFNRYIANSLGFMTAATSNYILNRIWTFESENRNIAGEYVSFVSIALLGLLINNGIIWLFSEKYRLNFYLSKLLAVTAVTLWNFVMNYYFTF
ncbi:MAG: GtrA family protein [Tannerella sp.]|nr:GtrA family protein [Tannerella sp.]